MTQTMLSRWLKLVAIVVGAALAVFFALLMPWLTLVLRHSAYIGYTPPTAAHGIALLAAVDLTAIHLSFVAAALFLMLAGAAVAVAAAALAHLTEKAARIKEENDLTV